METCFVNLVGIGRHRDHRCQRCDSATRMSVAPRRRPGWCASESGGVRRSTRSDSWTRRSTFGRVRRRGAAETSTALVERHPRRSYGCRTPTLCSSVDAVTSLGGDPRRGRPISHRRVLLGSQKCLGVSPGLLTRDTVPARRRARLVLLRETTPVLVPRPVLERRGTSAGPRAFTTTTAPVAWCSRSTPRSALSSPRTRGVVRRAIAPPGRRLQRAPGARLPLSSRNGH